MPADVMALLKRVASSYALDEIRSNIAIAKELIKKYSTQNNSRMKDEKTKAL